VLGSNRGGAILLGDFLYQGNLCVAIGVKSIDAYDGDSTAFFDDFDMGQQILAAFFSKPRFSLV